MSRTEIYHARGIISENPIIFYCNSTLSPIYIVVVLETKMNESRLGDEIRISCYNWKLPSLFASSSSIHSQDPSDSCKISPRENQDKDDSNRS